MEELVYVLMHRDDPVCTVTIDSESGTMLRVSKPESPELLPPGGNIDAEALRGWWSRRAVPVSQGHILRILESAGIAGTQKYLVKNLGLSLTDHYWIRPLSADYGWQDINLFTNSFIDPVGELQFSGTEAVPPELPPDVFSPGSSLQGDLRKKWVIVNGERFLCKANRGGNSQESLNETAASLLHGQQGRMPYVSYSLLPMQAGPKYGCMCAAFTSDSLELVSAFDAVQSEKKPNDRSVYEQLIYICGLHGLPEDRMRSFLEYEIVTDFILTNTDRHLRNIGMLRDTETLRYTGPAPIFDSGSSMFWNDPLLPLRGDLRSIEVNSFRSREMQLLKLIRGCNTVDPGRLPAEEELSLLYSVDPLIAGLDSILLGYRKKIDILQELKLL